MMKTAAGKSAGRPATSFSSAPMPPAEAPITTMSFVAMPRAMQASLPGMAPVACFATTNLVGGLFHQQDRALALLAGGDERRAGDAAADLLAAAVDRVEQDFHVVLVPRKAGAHDVA